MVFSLNAKFERLRPNQYNFLNFTIIQNRMRLKDSLICYGKMWSTKRRVCFWNNFCKFTNSWFSSILKDINNLKIPFNSRLSSRNLDILFIQSCLFTFITDFFSNNCPISYLPTRSLTICCQLSSFSFSQSHKIKRI